VSQAGLARLRHPLHPGLLRRYRER
jgi:hypothetical protein